MLRKVNGAVPPRRCDRSADPPTERVLPAVTDVIAPRIALFERQSDKERGGGKPRSSSVAAPPPASHSDDARDIGGLYAHGGSASAHHVPRAPPVPPEAAATRERRSSSVAERIAALNRVGVVGTSISVSAVAARRAAVAHAEAAASGGGDDRATRQRSASGSSGTSGSGRERDFGQLRTVANRAHTSSSEKGVNGAGGRVFAGATVDETPTGVGSLGRKLAKRQSPSPSAGKKQLRRATSSSVRAPRQPRVPRTGAPGRSRGALSRSVSESRVLPASVSLVEVEGGHAGEDELASSILTVAVEHGDDTADGLQPTVATAEPALGDISPPGPQGTHPEGDGRAGARSRPTLGRSLSDSALEVGGTNGGVSMAGAVAAITLVRRRLSVSAARRVGPSMGPQRARRRSARVALASATETDNSSTTATKGRVGAARRSSRRLSRRNGGSSASEAESSGASDDSGSERDGANYDSLDELGLSDDDDMLKALGVGNRGPTSGRVTPPMALRTRSEVLGRRSVRVPEGRAPVSVDELIASLASGGGDRGGASPAASASSHGAYNGGDVSGGDGGAGGASGGSGAPGGDVPDGFGGGDDTNDDGSAGGGEDGGGGDGGGQGGDDEGGGMGDGDDLEEFCRQRVDLGWVMKRGSASLDKGWQRRRVTIHRGRLAYFKRRRWGRPDKRQGWTDLRESFVSAAAPAELAGSGCTFGINVSTLTPVKRTFLFGLSSAAEVQRWSDLLRRHAEYSNDAWGEMERFD